MARTAKKTKVADIFASAKTEVVVPSKNGMEGKKAPEVKMTEIDTYASLCSLQKTIEAKIKEIRVTVEEHIVDYFVKNGAKKGEQPDNFRAVGKKASGSCELRRRSSNSVLNEQEREVLDTFELPYEESEILPERFFFNDDVLADPVKRMKVSKALLDAGLDDVIVRQEQQVKYIVSEDTMAALFATEDEKKIRALLKIVGVPAIKPKMNNTVSTEEILDMVTNIFTNKDED